MLAAMGYLRSFYPGQGAGPSPLCSLGWEVV